MLIQQGSRVLFFGDSITYYGEREGYVDMIREWIKDNHASLGVTLVGAGVKGDRITHLQARFNKDVVPKNPTIVLIYIGINDAGCNGKTPTPIATYEAGLRDVISRVRAINATPLLATPAVDGELLGGANPIDARIDQYCQISRDVASSMNCPLIDVRPAFVSIIAKYNIENGFKGVLTSDRVHPNAFGHRVLADLFLAALADRNIP